MPTTSTGSEITALRQVAVTVSDVERGLAFYRDGLGLPTHDYDPEQDVVFFALEGTWLAIWARGELAKDAAVREADSLLITVPNMLGVEYNARLLENIVRHVAPAIGWVHPARWPSPPPRAGGDGPWGASEH